MDILLHLAINIKRFSELDTNYCGLGGNNKHTVPITIVIPLDIHVHN